MARKVSTEAPPHYTTDATEIFIPETRGERITKTVHIFPHNGAMPAMSSADAAIDTDRRLSDALAKPAPAAPFARFGAQTMDTIQQLANIVAETGAPPNPTQPTRHTITTVQIPRRQHSTDPQEPPRVPPAVPPISPPRPPPDPPPRVDPPTRNPPYRYPLRSSAQSNHTVDTIGEGAIAFRGLLDPTTGKTQ